MIQRSLRIECNICGSRYTVIDVINTNHKQEPEARPEEF